MLNKLFIVYSFDHNIFYRKVTLSAKITRKTNWKNKNVKCGGPGKEPKTFVIYVFFFFLDCVVSFRKLGCSYESFVMCVFFLVIANKFTDW